MKKILPFLLLLSACSVKMIPIKGNYPSTPIIYTSEKTKDAIWDNLIDFFAQNGLSIKIIDRSSGLIIASSTALVWTYEDKKGVVYNKTAWVVLPKMYDQGQDKVLKPDAVTGEWNVRLKETDGKTSININLVNIQEIHYAVSGYYGHSQETKALAGRTTGKFEQMIYDRIK